MPRSRFNKIYNLAHMLGIPVSKLNNPEHFLLHHHPKDHQLINEARKTKEKKKNPPPLCCWYCYSTFPNLALFQKHLEEAHPNETLQKFSVKPSHKCPKCQKTFLTMYKLRQHLSKNFFLTIFLVKSKLSRAKMAKTTTFSRVFHPQKNRQFSREIKVEFLDKNLTFRIVCRKQ